MKLRQLSSTTLVQLLADEVEGPARELQQVLEARPDSSLDARTATAAVLSRTVEVKYTIARERGHRVDGLEGLLRILDREHGERVSVMVIDEGWSYFMVILTLEADRVLGVMHVVPLKAAPDGTSQE